MIVPVAPGRANGLSRQAQFVSLKAVFGGNDPFRELAETRLAVERWQRRPIEEQDFIGLARPLLGKEHRRAGGGFPIDVTLRFALAPEAGAPEIVPPRSGTERDSTIPP